MPGGWEWLILLVVVMLLFGAKRLPEMAKAVGQSARVFKGEMKGMKSDGEPGRAETARDQVDTTKPTGQASSEGASVTEQRGDHANGSR